MNNTLDSNLSYLSNLSNLSQAPKHKIMSKIFAPNERSKIRERVKTNVPFEITLRRKSANSNNAKKSTFVKNSKDPEKSLNSIDANNIRIENTFLNSLLNNQSKNNNSNCNDSNVRSPIRRNSFISEGENLKKTKDIFPKINDKRLSYFYSGLLMKLPPNADNWPQTSHKLSDIKTINKRVNISPASLFSINHVLNEKCQIVGKESIIDVLLKGKLVNNKIFQKYNKIVNERNLNSYDSCFRTKSNGFSSPNYFSFFKQKKQEENPLITIKLLLDSKNSKNSKNFTNTELNNSFMNKSNFNNLYKLKDLSKIKSHWETPVSIRKLNLISPCEKQNEKKTSLNSKYKKIMEEDNIMNEFRQLIGKNDLKNNNRILSRIELNSKSKNKNKNKNKKSNKSSDYTKKVTFENQNF